MSDQASERPSDRAIERATERLSDRATERSSDRETERPSGRAIERPSDRVTERAPERATELPSERPSDRVIEQLTVIVSRAPEVHLTRCLRLCAAFLQTSLSNTLPMLVYPQNSVQTTKSKLIWNPTCFFRVCLNCENKF